MLLDHSVDILDARLTHPERGLLDIFDNGALIFGQLTKYRCAVPVQLFHTLKTFKWLFHRRLSSQVKSLFPSYTPPLLYAMYTLAIRR